MVTRNVRTPNGLESLDIGGNTGDCYNVVESVNDLPAPVGGVRTLPAGTVTLVCGVITLPAGERIVVPNDSVLQGRHPEVDGIIGDVDAPLIDTAGNGLYLRKLYLVNNSAGASAYCARTTSLAGPAARGTVIDSVSFFGGVRGLLIDTAFFVSLSGAISRVDGEGVTFRGNVDAAQIFGYTMSNPTSPTARGIVFEAGSVVNSLRVNSSQFGLQQPTQIAVEQEAGATIDLVAFIGNAFLPLTIPFPTPLVGLSPNGQIDVLFFANYGVEESKYGGTISLNNPGAVPTVNPGVGTWARVGNGNAVAHPLYTLDGGSARVLLDQPAGAESARLVYGGTEPSAVTLSAALSLGPSALIAALQVGARLVHLPAGGGSSPISPAIFTSTSGIILSGASIALQGSIVLNPGDAIALEVQNATDGTDLVVDSANFGFVGT